MTSVLSLDEALLLDGIYYLAVVLLEVPSGYFSDRVGRRPTLMISCAGSLAGCLLFAAGGTFATFALAQLGMAVWYAFASGTDSSLLYDSLAGLGRPAEYLERESRSSGRAVRAYALSALAGGLAGAHDLRLPYVLSAAVALVNLAVCLRFHEPGRAPAPGFREFRNQVRVCWTRLADPVVRWAFAGSVALTVLIHVPAQFLQPWLEIVGRARPGLAAAGLNTPILAGILSGASLWLAGLVAPRVPELARSHSSSALVVGSLALTAGTMLVMTLTFHPAAAALLLLRSVPWAVAEPVIGSMVHPRLDPDHRATFMSIMSLAGRLAFGICLFTAAGRMAPGDPLSEGLLIPILAGFSAGAVAVTTALAGTRPRDLTPAVAPR